MNIGTNLAKGIVSGGIGLAALVIGQAGSAQAAAQSWWSDTNGDGSFETLRVDTWGDNVADMMVSGMDVAYTLP